MSKHELVTQADADALDGRAGVRAQTQDKPAVSSAAIGQLSTRTKKEPANAGSFVL
jgi:hypothetical protein